MINGQDFTSQWWRITQKGPHYGKVGKVVASVSFHAIELEDGKVVHVEDTELEEIIRNDSKGI